MEWIQKNKKTLAIAIMVVGILITTASLFSYASSVEAKEGYIPTTARIIDIEEYNISGEDTYRVLIRYKVGKEIYDRTIDYYDSSLKVGQEIKIAYHKNSILDVEYMDKNRTYAIVIIIIGSIMISVGLSQIIKIHNKNRKFNRGVILVEGKITEIIKDVKSAQLTRVQVGNFRRGDKINILIDLDSNRCLIDMSLQDSLDK